MAGNTVTPTSHSGVLNFIKPTVTELDINMCLRQVHFLKGQVKEEDICLFRENGSNFITYCVKGN